MLFRTRKLKGFGSSGQEEFSARNLGLIYKKKKFFRKMEEGRNPETLQLRSEKRLMSDTLTEMAQDKKGIRTQAVADWLAEKKYGEGDDLNRHEVRDLERDFQKLGMMEGDIRRGRRHYLEGVRRREREESLNHSREKLLEDSRVKEGSEITEEKKKAPLSLFGFGRNKRSSASFAENAHSFKSLPGRSDHSPLSSSRFHGAFHRQSPPPMPHLPQRPKF